MTPSKHRPYQCKGKSRSVSCKQCPHSKIHHYSDVPFDADAGNCHRVCGIYEDIGGCEPYYKGVKDAKAN
jgi:hypothetical protein